MEIMFFGLKIVVLLLMCHVLLRMLVYFRYQVTYYYHSRHIERFLEKKMKSAEEYINENRFLWLHNFTRAPHLRGGGTRAFVWALLCKAREDVAIRNFQRGGDNMTKKDFLIFTLIIENISIILLLYIVLI